MNVAVIHEFLNQYGGAERVFEAMLELYPNASIYAAVYDPKRLPERLSNLSVHSSFLQRIPFRKGLSFFYPLFFESLDLSSYDLVISSSASFAKGVLTGPQTLHISYIHTPPRFLYRFETETNRQRLWFLRPPLAILENYLRIWDYAAAQRPNFLIANSKETARRIRKFYRREASVIYPPSSALGGLLKLPAEVNTIEQSEIASDQQSRPIEQSEIASDQQSRLAKQLNDQMNDQTIGRGEIATPYKIRTSQPNNQTTKSPDNYFLVVSRLVAYKHIELAIEAANRLKLPLKIVGTGKEEGRLKRLAGPTVEFLGFLDDFELSRLYQNCQALIFPTDEDFGITPVEAMSLGKPVVALAKGGALETIVEGKTGKFFKAQTVDSLVNSLKKFDPKKYKAADCIAQAKKFSKERFQREFLAFINAKIKNQNAK